MTFRGIGLNEDRTERCSPEIILDWTGGVDVGHIQAVSFQYHPQQLSGRALIATIDNTRINLVSYQLEENGYNYRIVNGVDEAKKSENDPFDLVLADYDTDNPEEFRELRKLFCHISVIAMCDDIADGQQAMVDGASNYLCMPPSKEDIHMILELAMSNLQTSAS